MKRSLVLSVFLLCLVPAVGAQEPHSMNDACRASFNAAIHSEVVHEKRETALSLQLQEDYDINSAVELPSDIVCLYSSSDVSAVAATSIVNQYESIPWVGKEVGDFKVYLHFRSGSPPWIAIVKQLKGKVTSPPETFATLEENLIAIPVEKDPIRDDTARFFDRDGLSMEPYFVSGFTSPGLQAVNEAILKNVTVLLLRSISDPEMAKWQNQTIIPDDQVMPPTLRSCLVNWIDLPNFDTLGCVYGFFHEKPIESWPPSSQDQARINSRKR